MEINISSGMGNWQCVQNNIADSGTLSAKQFNSIQPKMTFMDVYLHVYNKDRFIYHSRDTRECRTLQPDWPRGPNSFSFMQFQGIII